MDVMSQNDNIPDGTAQAHTPIDWKGIGHQMREGIQSGVENLLVNGANLLVPGLGSLAKGVVSNFISDKRSEFASQKKFEEEINMLDYKHQLQKDLIDYQNEYNTPAKQVERLKDAGLSVGAMLSGGGSLNTPAQVPTTGNTSLESRANLMQANSAIQRLALDNKKVASEISTNQALANKYNAEASEIQNGKLPLLWSQVETESALTDLYRAQRDGVVSQKQGQDLSNFIVMSTSDNTIAMSSVQLQNATLAGLKMVEDTSLTVQTRKMYAAYTMVAGVEARAKEAGILLTDDMRAEVQARAKQITDATQIQNDQWSIDKKYRGAQHVVGMATDAIDSITGAVGAFTGAPGKLISKGIDTIFESTVEKTNYGPYGELQGHTVTTTTDKKTVK